MKTLKTRLPLIAVLAASCLFAGCDEDNNGDESGGGAKYSVGVIQTEAEGNRTLYLHVVDSLESGETYDNSNAIEFAGNSRHFEYDGAIYIGLAESPTLQKYELQGDALVRTGELRFPESTALTRIPQGLLFLSDTEAWLFNEDLLKIHVFDPSTMTITTTVDMIDEDSEFELIPEGFTDAEFWSPNQSDDYVYVPVRGVDWSSYAIASEARVAVYDKSTRSLIGVAVDDRCAAAGNPTLSDDGYVYVATDGRSHVVQALTLLAAPTTDQSALPATCLFRIKDGETEFDSEYYVELPDLLGGASQASEFYTTGEASDTVYIQAFELAELVAQEYSFSGFDFWQLPVFSTWAIELDETPTATQVTGLPWGIIGFGAVHVDGSMFLGFPATDGGVNEVYTFDPETNAGEVAFRVEGEIRDIYRIR